MGNREMGRWGDGEMGGVGAVGEDGEFGTTLIDYRSMNLV
jgi:hypothetical protein